MKSIVAGQYAVGSEEFAELALGVDSELFAGVVGESPVEWQARMDAARDVLADLRREAPDLADYAQKLLDAAPSPLFAGVTRTGKGRRPVLAVAA
ncbi:hypothetical protein ACGFX4_12560 [Kitasatospora sp. NPDC048365]|uniref:hypothetical protein n=1 Tax=Kitasatospora sp. NPDC048365 TaxID=3364050 RepID=UPI003711DABF